MSKFWLKMIGTADQPWAVEKPYDRQFVNFRGRKPSGIRAGDRMVLYAVGGSKRVFALVTVTKEWYESDQQDSWPYLVDIAWPPEVNLAPNLGVDVDEIGTDLALNLRRRSHIRLTSDEYERAATKLREASGAK